jgi:hypothetical protein
MHNHSRFKLDKVLTIGDMLTPMTVLVSVVALWITWSHDSDLRRRQYADQIRHSASVVTAKIERWAPLADRYFEDIQPAIIDASESVAETHSREPANRKLYKGLMEAQAKASQRIVEEQLEVAYIELYGYVPSLRDTFDKTIYRIKDAETHAHQNTIDTLQYQLASEAVLTSPNSIVAGNPLRSSAEQQRQQLRGQLEAIATPLRQKMLRLISLSDEDILNEQKREAAMADTPAASPSK